MENPQVFSVFEITRHLRQVIESSIDALYVKGEISNFVHHSSGHIYFNLKDEYATLRCTFFRNSNYQIGFKPADGQSVVCFGRLTLYEKGGSYNLNVSSMLQAGLGEMQARIDALKKKLQTEGLFDSIHKKPLPKYPETIGIVTSPTGAALQDISNILNRRYPVQAFVFPATVQGNEAAKTLIQGIRYFNEVQPVDLIILTRGGGSQEDLFCFNDESLARAIFASRIPIISAVGHEIDFSISDFVADLRAPTPSAAAEIAVPNRTDLLTYLASIEQRLRMAARNSTTEGKHAVSELWMQLSKYHPQRLWQDYQQRFDMAELALTNIKHLIREPQISLQRLEQRLQSSMEYRILGSIEGGKQQLLNKANSMRMIKDKYISDKNLELSAKAGLLAQLAPDTMLKKGWALAIKDGKAVKSIKDLAPGDVLQLMVSDGSQKVVVAED